MTPGRFLGVLVTIFGLGLALPGAGLPRISATSALVGIEYGSSPASLVRLDPVSLERVDPAAVQLDTGAGAWTLSPDGANVAFGNNDSPVLRIYDLAQLKLRLSAHLAAGPGSLDVLAWPKADRLLVLVQVSCCRMPSIVSVNPETGRVVARSSLHGDLRDWAPTADGAVLLIGRPNTIGPARLAVVTADGGMRRMTLARVRVGFRPKPSFANGQLVEPGLAVDAAGGRVFLVQATGPTAEIRLADMTATYHAIRSSARRLEAAQKEFRGPLRIARYLGDGRIAVSGYNGVRHGKRFAFVPAGLKVVDTRDWSARTIDPTSSWFTPASSLLLVVRGSDVFAYSVQGEVRFRVTIGQPLGIAAAVGRYVYLWQADNRIDVVDVQMGRVVHTTTPTSVTPIAVAP